MLNPSTNPSFIHRTIPSLPASTTTLLSSLTSQKQSLSAIRQETLSLLTTTLLPLRARALDLLIRALESKHSNLARNLELRAAEIALSAAKQEAQAMALLGAVGRGVYRPEVVEALGRYAGHLRDGKGRLREEIRGLEGELGRYGVDVVEGEGDGGKERAMREMARVYRDMFRQVEEVRGDLERLGRA